MNVFERAKNDYQRFSSDLTLGGTNITLTKPDGLTSVDIVGLATKHHIGIDTEGNLVNVKNVHISFAEQLVVDASFSIRNSNDEVYLKGYRATYNDSRGTSKTYVIREWMPDETLGVILCILGDYKAS